MEPLLASLEADLAVGPFLRRSIPDYLVVVEDPRLPRLPKFLINMYLPPARQNEIAVELARHITQEFATHFRRQSGPELAVRYRRKPMPSAMAS